MTDPSLAYSKGFPSQQAIEDFQSVVTGGDMLSINSALPDTPRKQVDADIFCASIRSSDYNVERSHFPDVPTVGSPEFDAEAAFVVEAAGLRDTPLESLPAHFPESMTSLSYFIEDYQVEPYAAGEDFVADAEALANVQAGNLPTESLSAPEALSLITTGRHCATYVHADNPLTPFAGAAAKLISLGCPYRKEKDMETSKCDPFINWGAPFFLGLLGECVRRGGLISFRHKWREMVPRPEQYNFQQLGTICSQAYPEGSPMHPSQNAMHSAAAIVQKECLLNIFDRRFILPNSRTVEEELNLLADNIGHWRVWAGVHYLSDHEAARPRAEAMGRLIASQALAGS